MSEQPPESTALRSTKGDFYFTEMTWSLDIYDLEAYPVDIPLHRSETAVQVWTIPWLARGACGGLQRRPAACRVAPATPSDARRSLSTKPDWTAEHLELREKVTDLGEYLLFLGRGDAFALSSNEFPANLRSREIV